MNASLLPHPACSNTLIARDGNGAPCSSLALAPGEEPGFRHKFNTLSPPKDQTSIPIPFTKRSLYFYLEYNAGKSSLKERILWEVHGQTRSGAKAKLCAVGQRVRFEAGFSLAHRGISYLCVFKDLSSNTLLELLNLFQTPRHFIINRNFFLPSYQPQAEGEFTTTCESPDGWLLFNVNYSIKHLFARAIVQGESLSLQPTWKCKDFQIFCHCFWTCICSSVFCSHCFDFSRELTLFLKSWCQN